MKGKVIAITKKLIKLPEHKPSKVKGAAGRVLVVGGSEDYAGAVYLAGMAALRSGADSVLIMAPTKVSWAINALTPDLVTKKLSGEYLRLVHWKQIQPALKTADVVLIGNGAGIKPETQKLLRKIMAEWMGLKVVDADAIKALRHNQISNAIITPNKKEFAFLKKNNNIQTLLSQNNVLLTKGGPAQVVSKTRTVVNKNTGSFLTKAGVGDVLVGLAAGFLAQSENLWQSAINTTYFAGLIGEILLKKKKGHFYLASEMIPEIKKVL
jgi:NAD(P)H-hydrate epimerase